MSVKELVFGLKSKKSLELFKSIFVLCLIGFACFGGTIALLATGDGLEELVGNGGVFGTKRQEVQFELKLESLR